MKRRWLVLAGFGLFGLLVGGCHEEPPIGPGADKASDVATLSPYDADLRVWGHAPLEEGVRTDPPEPGEKRVAVILIEFQDTLGYFTPADTAQIARIMWGGTSQHQNSVAGLYKEISTGPMQIEMPRGQGEMLGPYTIEFSSTSPCDDIDYEGYIQAKNQAIAEIGEQAFNTFDYYVYVYAKPNDCRTSRGWGGNAGGKTVRIYSWQSRSIWAHEFGHIMGWRHSGVGDEEYGDFSCIMSTSWYESNGGGSDLALRHAGAVWKNQAGWFTDNRVLTLNTPGTHELYLAPAERPSHLVVDPPADTAYQLIEAKYHDGTKPVSIYLSYRKREGFFYFDNNPNFPQEIVDLMDKVHVHTKPTSHTWRQAVLSVEDTFTYENGAVCVTVLESGPNGEYMKIEVSLIEPLPTVSILPGISEVANPTPGLIRTVQLSIRHNHLPDKSMTTYLIEPSVQPGFEVQPQATSITLMPGEQVNVPVNLIAASDIGEGQLVYSIKVTHASQPNVTKTAVATIWVDLGPPSTPANLRHRYVLPDLTLFWEASDDGAGWGVQEYEIWKNGQLLSYVPADQLSFVDSAVELFTLYTYQVRAWDRAGNASDWSDAYEVYLDCEPGNVLTGIATPITYTNHVWKEGFFQAMSLYITNQNGEHCGPLTFEYWITIVGNDPYIQPAPEGLSSISVEAGTTVEIGAIYFMVPPAEGSYSAIGRIWQTWPNTALLGTYEYTYVLDTTAPTAPLLRMPDVLMKVVEGGAEDLVIGLTWHRSTDQLSGVDHYEVLRDGVVLGQASTTTYTDYIAFLASGQSVVYQVRSVDRAGNKSELSNAQMVSIP